jgi:uncharacterized protein
VIKKWKILIKKDFFKMKHSRYNFFSNNNDRTICFNGLSGKVFSVTDDEYCIIQNVLKSSKSQEDNLLLTKWLTEYHFLVDENTDESQLILKKNRSEVFGERYYLIINPTLECNFRCWYCYEQHPDGRMMPNIMVRIKQYVDRLVNDEKIKGFTLGWFGGEPLLYFYEVVYPLAIYFKNKFLKLDLPFSQNMTTNGYCIDQEMISKFDEIDLRHFQITLDGDNETHNRTRNQQGKPSFDKILQNIIDICKYLPKSEVLLRINFTNEIIAKDFSVILEPIPQCIRSQIQIHFQRVWQTSGTSAICNDDIVRNISCLSEMGFSVTPNNYYSVRRTHRCYADRYNYAHINFDGSVYKGTARDYTDEHSLGELTENGVIKWKSDIIEKMHTKANFENKKCMKCNLLPMCGGPCLQRTLDFEKGIASNICVGKSNELDVNTFIREYYTSVKKKHHSLSA